MARHSTHHLPPEVGDALGWYVYLLIDPADDRPFYVGKGHMGRALSHLRRAEFTEALEASGEPAKVQSATQQRIRRILRTGQRPRVDIVKHGLPDERTALDIEAALISTLRPLAPAVQVTNAVGGHDSGKGRATLDELVSRYGAPELTATEPPVVMIRLARWKPGSEPIEGRTQRQGHGWYQGISQQELYDSTRGWWKISPVSLHRHGAHHAVAVHAGVTRCVIEIDHDSWRQRPSDDRWAFNGQPLDRGRIFDAYVGPLGKRVPFEQSAQNPIRYWSTDR